MEEKNMNDYFIQKIIIKEVRDIKNLEIPLDKNRRKHLIITGKNGSGKTSTLLIINDLLNKFINNGLKIIEKNMYQYNSSIRREKLIEGNKEIAELKKEIEEFSKVDLIFSNYNELHTNITNGKFILAYFEAKRETQAIVPTSIQNIKLNQKNSTETKDLHKQFIIYMVRLRNKLLNEKFDGSIEEAEKIQKWFDNFENVLKELFSQDNLKLKYYNNELNFKIEYDGKSFGLNELSDGYSSLLTILTELILRMEAHGVSAYDMQGVVLVDEIETHLHVALQKKVLPFLTSFFKNIQFIVTTHSPFVLSSLSNAVICDLEKRFVTTDLSAYSYDALIESYFNSDKYSKEVKEKIEVFERLTEKDNLSDSEKDKYYKLKKYFDSLPTFRADELAVKINEIKLKNMFKA
jgi:predicted ATP-binding protein involved in virulence